MIIVLMFQSLREQNLRMEAAVSESKYECLLFGEFRLQTVIFDLIFNESLHTYSLIFRFG